MGSQSNNTSTSTSSKKRKAEKVQTTQNDDQSQDPDVPDFVRRGSYYETGVTDRPQFTYLQASDVRRQVQQAPAQFGAEARYPRPYHNNPPEPLTSQAPHREFPIVPSPAPGQAPSNFQRGMPYGPVRAFYNENDRTQFDAGYHDDTRPPTGPRKGSQYPKSPYSLATYHPGPTASDDEKSKKKKKK
ncbi:uncharacterized protein PG986_002905 [Apiospora aurea]|uniref:Uncharacterized protein n=1 Tax=Apiospora aurea TaxID=335848 RepID=A0ABR1QQC9_9PEZI